VASTVAPVAAITVTTRLTSVAATAVAALLAAALRSSRSEPSPRWFRTADLGGWPPFPHDRRADSDRLLLRRHLTKLPLFLRLWLLLRLRITANLRRGSFKPASTTVRVAPVELAAIDLSAIDLAGIELAAIPVARVNWRNARRRSFKSASAPVRVAPLELAAID